jgi:hypothetical protein
VLPELVVGLVDTALHRITAAVTIGSMDAIVNGLADVGTAKGIVLPHFERIVGGAPVASLDVAVAMNV